MCRMWASCQEAAPEVWCTTTTRTRTPRAPSPPGRWSNRCALVANAPPLRQAGAVITATTVAQVSYKQLDNLLCGTLLERSVQPDDLPHRDSLQATKEGKTHGACHSIERSPGMHKQAQTYNSTLLSSSCFGHRRPSQHSNRCGNMGHKRSAAFWLVVGWGRGGGGGGVVAALTGR